MEPENFAKSKFDNQLTPETSKSRRALIASLLILAFLVVGAGFWQLAVKIKSPFRLSKEQLAAGLPGQVNVVDQSVDTDGDGLTDYEEVFIYGTSPYLEDTDGDGISDKEEIERGTDPNCPEGETCFNFDSYSAQPATATSGDPTTILGLGEFDLNGEVSEEDMQRMLIESIDAATLRQLLLDSGADGEALSQISDEELMRTYQEALNNNQGE